MVFSHNLLFPESENMELLHISLHLCLLGNKKKKNTSVHWDEDDLVSGRILQKKKHIQTHPRVPPDLHSPSIPLKQKEWILYVIYITCLHY